MDAWRDLMSLVARDEWAMLYFRTAGSVMQLVIPCGTPRGPVFGELARQRLVFNSFDLCVQQTKPTHQADAQSRDSHPWALPPVYSPSHT